MQFKSLKLTGLALALGFSAATTSAADLIPVTVTTTWVCASRARRAVRRQGGRYL